ncbi:hypothetical protein [Brevundimonas lenta]|uniref:Lipoprotein n=1 Tax=Brevundimonas lenta TaxID=424796 RepID=A0A7W6JFZ3_9CAUL|nr:hypothetical protein [Brevundimonas lenta]MBB4083401.1 hypothetical protein [Brevundimonas lenta]
MRVAIRGGVALAMLLVLAACVNSPAPAYQPGIANLQVLRAGAAPIAVDDFAADAGVNNSRFSLRGNTMTGAGVDSDFSTYLQQALESELRTAGRLDAASGLRLSGTLTTNRLDAADSAVGNATVGARFVLTRDGRVVYDRRLVADHTWESSFMGAIAIPAAFQGYAATVQMLIGQLFADPAFIEASR